MKYSYDRHALPVHEDGLFRGAVLDPSPANYGGRRTRLPKEYHSGKGSILVVRRRLEASDQNRSFLGAVLAACSRKKQNKTKTASGGSQEKNREIFRLGVSPVVCVCMYVYICV